MEYNLSNKEFIFLFFAAGATEIYGIEDAFRDVNPNDMSAEIRKVHNSLEMKEYMESDFDGNSTIKKDLLGAIQSCINCSTIVIFNSYKRKNLLSINYYLSEDTSYKAKRVGDDYVLTEIDNITFPKDLLSHMLFKSKNDFSDKYESTFKQNSLEKIKKNLQRGKKDEAIAMLKTKVNENLLDVLISALEENEDFYSLLGINNGDEASMLDAIMAIDTDRGALIVQSQIVDFENAVKIISCTHGDLDSLVKRFIKKISKQYGGDY